MATGKQSKLLILSDGKPGHLNQALALARYVGLPYEIVRVGFRNKLCKLFSYAADWLGVAASALFSTATIDNGGFRAVVSCGSETYYANKLLARKLGIPSVAVMLPRGYRLDFDLIIAQEHDSPPVMANVLTLPVNLCCVVPQNVFVPDSGKRYVAVVVGGPNDVYAFEPHSFSKVLDGIFQLFPDHHIVLTTSRRTPLEIEQITDRYPFAWKVIYSQNPVNPVPDFLAVSDYVFITADSTSMISEAVTFGTAKVEIIPLSCKGNVGKFGQLIAILKQKGALHVFDGTVGGADVKIDLAGLLKKVQV